MDLEELKKLHDKAYTNAQVTRERAADDLVFYWITQWDDNLLSTSDLAFRGQFDILRKAGRQVMADLRANPVQVDFEPTDESRDDSAEVIDGLYRSDDRRNTSQESYTNAAQEAVVCGVGAWELFTEYESTRSGSNNQVIRRTPIHEANNNVFWDPNAKLMDKSDADYCSILTPYSKDAYKEFVKDLTGDDDYDVADSNFKFPQQSYAFPWTAGNFEWIYVSTFYHRVKVTDTYITLIDPLTGMESSYWEDDLAEVMDELIDSGHVIIGNKEVERYRVTKYLASGEKILAEYEIAGDHIPVVCTYGERSIIEGQEHWEGITRLAKDPVRLRNFMMSYIADIASRSPRPKPIFYSEQIEGFQDMYEQNGAENNLPYLLQNRLDDNGQPLPLGPAAQLPEQTIPSAVAALVGMTKEAVEDVAGSGMPRDVADIDLSGEALQQLNARIDMQSHVYQENLKHAKRRDAEIYASMAAEVYDVPRKVTLTLADGTRKQVEVMKEVMDRDTGKSIVLNDLKNAEFEVFADIGPSYKTQKDQVRRELTTQLQAMPPDDPMRELIWLTYAQLMDGVDTKEVREYARKQAILKGYKEPETEEEQAMVMKAQQNQQQDPASILAQAEVMKGQAAMLKEQREAVKDQAEIEQKNAELAIDQFNAMTDRFEAQVDAQFKQSKVQVERTKAMSQGFNRLRASIA